MQAILEDKRSGSISTYEVPPPELRPGGILVKTSFSAISAGTERAKVETSGKSLLGKAMDRPDLVKQVVAFAKDHGVRAAYEKVQTKLDQLTPLGYSCSGTVIGVGEGVREFVPGDRVACAGGGYANHSSINFVPKNLAVRIPHGVSFEAAALSTIGAIAMQGLRQAQVQFGETVVIIGAGLLGVLAIQIAKAAGCRVIAIDANSERVGQALSFGAAEAFLASEPGLERAVMNTSRYGADAVLITAGARSNEPIELAARLCRERGRIVIVGAVSMDVSREHVYHKELSIVMSRSYGPGRYDSTYEEGGHDYPVGFVRWTEQRNMEAFLDLLAAGSVDVAPLLRKRYKAAEGALGYEALRDPANYTAIIEYADTHDATVQGRVAVTAPPRPREKVRVGCIGAGGFARSMIFPKLKSARYVQLAAIATASGVAAESAKKAFQFARALSPAELIGDADIDAVFVLSRHDSHAAYVCGAIDAGKAVFVEKPLAVDVSQLKAIIHSYRAAASPFLVAGFNRRFAPATDELRRVFRSRREPLMVRIEVNAGYLPLDHWTHQDGGRFIGEGCHFVDWARAVVGTGISSISGAILPNGTRYAGDNVMAHIRFDDGSLAAISYFANGDKSVPKERFQVSGEGIVATLTDFKILEVARDGRVSRKEHGGDKGHQRLMELTLEAMRTGGASPLPFEELVESSWATCAVLQAAATGEVIDLRVDESPDRGAEAAQG